MRNRNLKLSIVQSTLTRFVLLSALISVSLMMTACDYGKKPLTTLTAKPIALMQPCPQLHQLNDPYTYVSNAVENFGLYKECKDEKQGMVDWINKLYK